jgi:serine phosphatase RsbU (regulator of sigma subunit)
MAAESVTTYRRPRVQRILRTGIIAIGLAIGVGLLMSLEASPEHRLITLELSCLSGAVIWLTATGLGLLLGPRISRLPIKAALMARAAVYLTSALVAWVVVNWAAWQRGIEIGPQAPLMLALTAGMAIAAGFSFYSFEVIRGRLEQSVVRIQEMQFAEKELLLARELQSRLLPPPEIDGEGWRAAARNLAAQMVAGDFYDVVRLPAGRIGLAVGDVAGKGMAAALVMASVKAMLPLVAAERSAAATLSELNRRLFKELPDRAFVALAFACFDPVSGEVELANAGLPDPYLLAVGGEPAPLGVPGPRLPLGARQEVEYASLSLRLAAGDRLLLLSDGLPEAPVGDGEPLGYAAFAGLLAATRGGDPGHPGAGLPLAWIDDLLTRIRAATAVSREDDWTILMLERTPWNS